jgi:hypothetical protein
MASLATRRIRPATVGVDAEGGVRGLEPAGANLKKWGLPVY